MRGECMIAFSVASKQEWFTLVELLNIKERQNSPFGEFFFHQGALFYQSLTRKSLSSACTQWMIDHHKCTQVIVIGTCAGVNPAYKELDLFQFNKTVQCDVLDVSFGQLCAAEVSLYCFEELSFLNTGKISTMDKPLIRLEDANNLLSEDVDCDDMECAAVALTCKMNNVKCSVIKGISDFPNGVINFEVQDQKYRQNAKLIMKDIVERVLPVILKYS